MLILKGEMLARVLDYPSAVEALEEAWREPSHIPARSQVDLGAGKMWLMPAAAGGAAGVKVVTQFDGNAALGLDRIQGSYLYLDGENGVPMALLDGRVLTAIRTAAVSALATRLLANPGRRTLAIFGTGVQALSHLEAMRACFDVGEILVCGSTPEKSRAFATRHECRAVTAQECCQASLICACTTSRTPLWDGNWLAEGAHINAIGNSRPDACELDAVTVQRARIAGDTRHGVLEEAGDLLVHGAGDRIVADLREMLVEGKKVRSAPSEITLFKSVGYALGDLALARLAYRRSE
jgi:ornithine cyclodeaminase